MQSTVQDFQKIVSKNMTYNVKMTWYNKSAALLQIYFLRSALGKIYSYILLALRVSNVPNSVPYISKTSNEFWREVSSR